MIYFLHGPDSYRRREKLNEIIAAYRLKHAHADMYILDCEDSPDAWREAMDFAVQPSMFAPSKVLVVRESGAVKEKEWIKFLKKNILSKDIFIFISDTKGPLKDFSFLRDAPHVMEFSELTGKKFETFVVSVAKKNNLVFSPDALRMFVSLIGTLENKSWVAVSEMEKLALLGIGDVSPDDIKKHTEFASKSVMYEEARKMLRARNFYDGLAIFERLISSNEAPSYIFNSLGFQASGEDAVRLAEYDVKIKSGTLEYEEALLDFILSKNKTGI
jgi:DNA polymerase III delta subunit